jgi:hypothetical protein
MSADAVAPGPGSAGDLAAATAGDAAAFTPKWLTKHVADASAVRAASATALIAFAADEGVAAAFWREGGLLALMAALGAHAKHAATWVPLASLARYPESPMPVDASVVLVGDDAGSWVAHQLDYFSAHEAAVVALCQLLRRVALADGAAAAAFRHDQGLAALVSLVGSSSASPAEAQYGCAALEALASRPTGAAHVVAAGGVGAMLRVLHGRGGAGCSGPETMRHACGALGSLCSASDAAQRAVVAAGGMAVLLRALEAHRGHLHAARAALELLRSVAQCDEGRQALSTPAALAGVRRAGGVHPADAGVQAAVKAILTRCEPSGGCVVQ